MRRNTVSRVPRLDRAGANQVPAAYNSLVSSNKVGNTTQQNFLAPTASQTNPTVAKRKENATNGKPKKWTKRVDKDAVRPFLVTILDHIIQFKIPEDTMEKFNANFYESYGMKNSVGGHIRKARCQFCDRLWKNDMPGWVELDSEMREKWFTARDILVKKISVCKSFHVRRYLAKSAMAEEERTLQMVQVQSKDGFSSTPALRTALLAQITTPQELVRTHKYNDQTAGSSYTLDCIKDEDKEEEQASNLLPKVDDNLNREFTNGIFGSENASEESDMTPKVDELSPSKKIKNKNFARIDSSHKLAEGRSLFQLCLRNTLSAPIATTQEPDEKNDSQTAGSSSYSSKSLKDNEEEQDSKLLPIDGKLKRKATEPRQNQSVHENNFISEIDDLPPIKRLKSRLDGSLSHSGESLKNIDEAVSNQASSTTNSPSAFSLPHLSIQTEDDLRSDVSAVLISLVDKTAYFSEEAAFKKDVSAVVASFVDQSAFKIDVSKVLSSLMGLTAEDEPQAENHQTECFPSQTSNYNEEPDESDGETTVEEDFNDVEIVLFTLIETVADLFAENDGTETYYTEEYNQKLSEDKMDARGDLAECDYYNERHRDTHSEVEKYGEDLETNFSDEDAEDSHARLQIAEENKDDNNLEVNFYDEETEDGHDLLIFADLQSDFYDAGEEEEDNEENCEEYWESEEDEADENAIDSELDSEDETERNCAFCNDQCISLPEDGFVNDDQLLIWFVLNEIVEVVHDDNPCEPDNEEEYSELEKPSNCLHNPELSDTYVDVNQMLQRTVDDVVRLEETCDAYGNLLIPSTRDASNCSVDQPETFNETVVEETLRDIISKIASLRDIQQSDTTASSSGTEAEEEAVVCAEASEAKTIDNVSVCSNESQASFETLSSISPNFTMNFQQTVPVSDPTEESEPDYDISPIPSPAPSTSSIVNDRIREALRRDDSEVPDWNSSRTAMPVYDQFGRYLTWIPIGRPLAEENERLKHELEAVLEESKRIKKEYHKYLRKFAGIEAAGGEQKILEENQTLKEDLKCLKSQLAINKTLSAQDPAS